MTSNAADLIEVRRSDVHGLGVFAARRIAKGTRIIEYLGERVSHAEADRRYEEKDAKDSHTFLFIVDSRTVIDAGVDGNDARFINHSCDPNCESVIQSRRVYIEATRDIEPGAELSYDYQIEREDDDPEDIDEVFACRCGFIRCRGTMLWPTERKPKRAAKRKRTRSSATKSTGRAKGTGAGRSSATRSVKSAARSGRSAVGGRSRSDAGRSAVGGRSRSDAGRAAVGGRSRSSAGRAAGGGRPGSGAARAVAKRNSGRRGKSSAAKQGRGSVRSVGRRR